MIRSINVLTNNYNYPSFTGKRINITKEQILQLRALGKNEREIQKELGVSLKTYYNKLKKLGIPSRTEIFNNTISKISKEKFEDLLKKKVPIDEICKIFKITNNAYYTMIEKLGLRKYIVGANKKAVTKEKLQELIDKQLSIEEICKELNIGNRAYYELVQKFDIKTTYRLSKEQVSAVTKEAIVNLLNSGKTPAEICQMLGISRSSFQKLITDFNIETKNSKTRKIKSAITKEILESLVREGKQVSEICKELNITERQYSELIIKFNIMTKHRQGKANINRITKEQLQELVDNGFTVQEICRRLNISENAFYKLLKRLDINYKYRHHANEVYIPKTQLEQTVKEWTSAKDIENKLNVTPNTFYEKVKQAKVKTQLSDSIKKINDINPEEIQELLNQGIYWKDICKMYNLTESNYHVLVRNYGIISPTKRTFLNAQNITKEQLEELIKSGKQVKEICQILNISTGTYLKKLREFEQN